jgi:dTDP-4-amino-4,6-dideoxygalactose transaminase
VRTQPFPPWPVFDRLEEDALLGVLRSGMWFRGNGKNVARFEEEYAGLMGARYCLATANGTSALIASLAVLGVGPGDEVILPPYTFVATVNVVLLHHALPIFVDTDPETFQIDASRVDAAVTASTRVLLPVHIGGLPADLDAVISAAREHSLPVVEDACQAHLAEWRTRKVGTVGAMGCFSFQASKHLNAGEGGAVLTDDAGLAEKCYAFHNNSRGQGRPAPGFAYTDSRGANLRMTEFQAALLKAQMTRLQAQSSKREENARYLTQLLTELPGVQPARLYEGCTRAVYHLYMFRYQKEHFAGMARAKFLQALSAEGVPCSAGYAPLNREPFRKNTLQTRGYRTAYPPQVLASWEERTRCPNNDRLCQEAVWFAQTCLLGERTDMEQIAEAIRKVQRHASELART